MTDDSKPLPLAGMRILDPSTVIAAPAAQARRPSLGLFGSFAGLSGPQTRE